MTKPKLGVKISKQDIVRSISTSEASADMLRALFLGTGGQLESRGREEAILRPAPLLRTAKSFRRSTLGPKTGTTWAAKCSGQNQRLPALITISVTGKGNTRAW